MRALFATALEDGLIRSNPATGLRLPRVTPIDVERGEDADEGPKPLTEAEFGDLLWAADERWRPLFRFVAATGLRISEAVALRFSDVDFGRRRVRVRRRVHKGRLDAPKSRYGRRDVPLSAGMARELWRLRKDRGGGEDALVFPGRDGGYLDASTAYRAIKVAAKRAGVPWAGLHTLRHTCATTLFRRGLNAKQVQLWLGHHSPAFTLATCVHLLADDLPDPAFLDELPGMGATVGQQDEPRQAETLPLDERQESGV